MDSSFLKAVLALLLAGLVHGQGENEYVGKCIAEITACSQEPSCPAAMDCFGTCFTTFDPGCLYGCGLYSDEEPDALIQCQADSGYFPAQTLSYGGCKATVDDGVRDMTGLSGLEGRWWQLKGLNCNQSVEWIGGYDNLPCTSLTFDAPGGDGIGIGGRHSYCYGSGGRCDTPLQEMSFRANLTSPGVLHAELSKATGVITPTHEDLIVISRPDPDWMLVVTCRTSPLFSTNGASVMSKRTGLSEMPSSVESAFRAAATRQGFRYDGMCSHGTQHCLS